MSSMALDDGEVDRRLERLESRYRKACLLLDLARLEYYQLKRDAADPARIATAQGKVLHLTHRRDALRAALDRLEDLH